MNALLLNKPYTGGNVRQEDANIKIYKDHLAVWQ